MKNVWFTIAVMASGILAAQAQQLPNAKPNIIYILADDIRYGDLSSLNPGSKIKPPNMDKLVGQGVSFSDAHSNSAVCTPTRFGILLVVLQNQG